MVARFPANFSVRHTVGQQRAVQNHASLLVQLSTGMKLNSSWKFHLQWGLILQWFFLPSCLFNLSESTFLSLYLCPPLFLPVMNPTCLGPQVDGGAYYISCYQLSTFFRRPSPLLSRFLLPVGASFPGEWNCLLLWRDN